jgi:aryl-alcohol dehydrogenase-like predicted oxidoreductase
MRTNIGFGCAGLSSQAFEHNALKLLETSFDEGITHFDTAPLYGKGYSEKIVGKFLKRHRAQVTVTTKFGLSGGGTKNIPVWLALPLNQLKKKIKRNPAPVKTAFQKPGLLSYRKIEITQVRNSFEKSLKNLQTDYIDYYLLHEAMPEFLTDEALSYVMELRQKGFVKKIGVAVSYTNFYNTKPGAFDHWDILQYENSILHPSDELLDLFPAKKHFYHSVLKPLQYKKVTAGMENEIAGLLLTKALKINSAGITLFSTSKYNNIKNNLRTIDAYANYSLDELNNILLNAIY